MQEPRCFGSHVLPITSHGFRVPGDNGVPGVPGVPGVILLEALASGLPVVASRIPGNVDLVLDQENGLLFSIDELRNDRSRNRAALEVACSMAADE